MDNQRVQNGFVDGRNEAVGLHSEQNQASTTGLAILPVKVKAKGFDQMIQTYAFLDNGSNASSCSEELANQLNLSGKRTTLSLTTMERENSKTDCRVVSLEVLEKYVLCSTAPPSTMASLSMTNSYRGRILQIPSLEC